jgi:protein phosphatase
MLSVKFKREFKKPDFWRPENKHTEVQQVIDLKLFHRWRLRMNDLPNPIYRQKCSVGGNCNKWLPMSVVLWQGEPSGLPQWLWFAIASPIVAAIILLTIAILLLLIIIWLRTKHQRQKEAEQALRLAKQQESLPSTKQEEISELPPTQPVEPATAPYSEDMARTQPSAIVRDAPAPPPIKVEQEPQTIPVSGQRPANIGWQIAGLTDVGLKRELNEDSLLMTEGVMSDGTPYGLYVVADGLGGHQGGEIASQLTTDAIQAQFAQQPPTPSAAPFDGWLKDAAMVANKAVLAHQQHRKQAKKMGSTAVMALIAAGQAHIANVGDSRAYHLNSEDIRQISVDHSLVERLVQIGQLSREEARTHKNRNVVYNTIGDKPEMEVGLYHIPMQPGDRLLLCSDGLSGMITDEEILDISRSRPTPAEACRAMVEAAKAAGGNDNITAIIVQMGAE